MSNITPTYIMDNRGKKKYLGHLSSVFCLAYLLSKLKISGAQKMADNIGPAYMWAEKRAR